MRDLEEPVPHPAFVMPQCRSFDNEQLLSSDSSKLFSFSPIAIDLENVEVEGNLTLFTCIILHFQACPGYYSYSSTVIVI